MNTATELDVNPRIYPIMGTNVDMGAYEYYINSGTMIRVY